MFRIILRMRLSSLVVQLRQQEACVFSGSLQLVQGILRHWRKCVLTHHC